MSGKINNWQGGGYSGRAVFSERFIQEYGVFRKMGYSGRGGIQEEGREAGGIQEGGGRLGVYRREEMREEANRERVR